MKNIILRGRPGVGKSTLLTKLISQSGLPICGFMTKKIVKEDKTIEIYIHPADQAFEERVYTRENLLARWEKGTDRVAFPDSFDHEGVRLLKNQKETGILVMDELGFLEKDAKIFQKTVLELLGGKLLILAAIKDKENDFLKAVAEHPRTQIYDITKENRDELYLVLREQLLSHIG